MNTLRVAMGYGWLKEIVKEINMTLEFAPPATIHEQSQELHCQLAPDSSQYRDREPLCWSNACEQL